MCDNTDPKIRVSLKKNILILLNTAEKKGLGSSLTMSLKNSDPEFFLKFILKNNLNIQHHEGGFLIKQNISFYGTIIIYPSKLKIYAHLLTQKAMLNMSFFFEN